jgi:FkbM family methyltransferase
MLAKLKKGARRFIVRHPGLNPVLRTVWRGFARGPLSRGRTRFPVVGRFPVQLPGPEGKTLLLSTDSEDWSLNELYWNGFDAADRQDLAIFQALARSARTVIDIGANLGIFALAAALENPKAAVHAFEPLPAAHRLLERMIRLNGPGNVAAHRLALSDAEGSSTLYVPHKEAGHVRDASLVEGWREGCEAVAVKMTTLDAFAAGNSLSAIDLIKIDVETAEAMVLSGGRQTLRRDRPAILCEVLHGTTEEKLQEVMDGLGYRYFWSSPEGLVEHEDLVGDDTYRFRNYLFVAEEQAEQALGRLEGVVSVAWARAPGDGVSGWCR